MESSALEAVAGIAGNDRCADCEDPAPRWAALLHGTLLCLACAGWHRGLGVGVSRVRSLNLDRWPEPDVARMLVSGNASANVFFRTHGEALGGWRRYATAAAVLLRKTVDAKVRGDIAMPEAAALTADDLAVLAGALVERRGRAGEARPTWVPDAQARRCMLCDRAFSVVRRRHHCRRCGRCACEACAPGRNTKPIPQLGYVEPVRHCKVCFRSAGLSWAAQRGDTATSGEKDPPSFASGLEQGICDGANVVESASTSEDPGDAANLPRAAPSSSQEKVLAVCLKEV